MFRIILTITVFLIGVLAVTTSAKQQRTRRLLPAFKQAKPQGLNLPANATSIRENIVNTFSCDKRIYGYYADMDNDCQIFHVCVPQTRKSIRYSFICPAETVFNQATFVCTRNESSIPCEESEKYYKLNEAFGKEEVTTEQNMTNSTGQESGTTMNPSNPTNPSQKPTKPQGTTFPTQRPQMTTYPSQRPTRPQSTIGPQIGSTNYPQRPSTTPTYPPNTPDYLTTQFTQRPPKPNQGNRWRPILDY